MEIEDFKAMLDKRTEEVRKRLAALPVDPPEGANEQEKLDFFRGRKEALEAEMRSLQEDLTKAVGLFDQLTNAVMSQGPHGVALVFAQAVDNELTELIFSHMPGLDVELDRSLFKGSAPLATFSAKIDLAKAMGIIEAELWVQLHRLRRLRNKFAHASKVLSFEDQIVIDHVNNLEGLHQEIADLGPKARFMGAIHTMILKILEKRSEAGVYQRSERDDLN
ncbi:MULTISPECIES: MltR family transcriptional regulator [unclassified Mesorhizobium]|uniref:MltR family transcriptional regulator n=1 Tax=unclassified Mesorhizobium TaxID=325217 RepID=UPI0015E451DD|nr:MULTISPECIES: MltR family transcriptional regulator [unclassified Mesorhizobium]